jgi:hypothetical protein
VPSPYLSDPLLTGIACPEVIALAIVSMLPVICSACRAYFADSGYHPRRSGSDVVLGVSSIVGWAVPVLVMVTYG